MSNSRIDRLRRFLEEDPRDPFTRYALALELDAAGQTPDGVALLEALASDSPDYVPAYQMLGTIYLRLDRREDARAILQRGIQAAADQQDHHARAEMQEALDDLAS